MSSNSPWIARAKALPSQEAAQKAVRHARSTLVRHLRSDGEADAVALAERVAACAPDRPCNSGACPVCGLRFQQKAAGLVERFIRAPSREVRGRAHMLTIIPAEGVIELGRLDPDDFSAVRALVRSLFEKLRLPPAIIGIEAAAHEDPTRSVEPIWVIHAHALGVDWLTEAERNELGSEVSAHPRVKRPVKYQALDARPNADLYPFKPQRERSVTNWVRNERGDPTRDRESKDRPLRPDQAVELALVDDAVGFKGRLALHQIDRGAVRQHWRACSQARDGP